MKRGMVATSLIVGILILTAGTAHAMNITIADKVSAAGANGWYGDREDQEVEPGCVATQAWDLEGFYLNGNTLSMVGGYNFASGEKGFTSGDIFLDVDGDVVYGVDNYSKETGPGYASVQNKWGYDYAIDLNFTDNTYTVYAIDGDTLLTTVYYRKNDASNPWEYSTGGTSAGFGTFDYLTNLSDDAAADDGYVTAGGGHLKGHSHNIVSLDLSFLNPNTTITAHFTMGCGNDNLMGKGTTSVPEPGTLLLLGIGLLGLAGLRGRKRS